MPRPFPPTQPIALPEQAGQSFPRLVALMQRLLADDGCPWDRAQTFATLRAYVLEEGWEVADAIDEGNRAHLCEELGDLLLQIVFQGELGRAEGSFGPDDIIAGIVNKLVHRHPHVFAEGVVGSAADVERNWEQSKRTERGQQPLLAGIPKSMPALARAARVGKKVRQVGFDWPDSAGSRAKVVEELGELDAAVASGKSDAVMEELGDVLFSLVNFARHLGVDPEAALQATTNKVTMRFAHVEHCVRQTHGDWPQTPEGKPGPGVALEQMEGYWEEAKGR